MNQIKQNPVISIAADWFTASGTGENIGGTVMKFVGIRRVFSTENEEQ